MALLFARLILPRPLSARSLKVQPVPDGGGGDKDFISSFKTIDDFLGEDVAYDISFLWFKRAAEGRLKFTREGEGYMAVLEAETKGVVGFFTSYRRHRYVSHLSWLPETKKFRVDLFERHVIIGKREEKTYTWLDYDRHMMSWEDYKRGALRENKSEPIPNGVEYECILSAFYNFRMGVFGPVKRGRNFSIRTIPEKGKSTIDVSITTREEALRKRRLFGKAFDPRLFCLSVRVPKEIFRSKTGEVSILFDEELLPVVGVVKDYIGFGDVKGMLKRV